MKIALLTREYPPDVYGGAGVHVEYLARELARSAEAILVGEGPAAHDARPDRAEIVGRRALIREPPPRGDRIDAR